MALLQAGPNTQPETIEAAAGRFFNDSYPGANMYTFSQTVFVDNKSLLHDDRGILVQFPTYETDNSANPEPVPHPAAIHTLALDGSRLSSHELAWRYIVAVPDKGRTVEDLYVAPGCLEATGLIYDQQGSLRKQVKSANASKLGERIRAIVEGPVFKQKTAEVADMKAEAEESFEQFVANLIAKGADLRRMKAVIDKREAVVKRRGFVACSAIVRH